MPAPTRFTAVSLRDTIPPMDVPAHHVYLEFNIEADAKAFREWWAERGRTLFAMWEKEKALFREWLAKATAGGEVKEAATKETVYVNGEPTPPRLLADCIVEIGPPVDPPPACPRCGAKATHAKLLGGRCANCSTVTVR
jgi:hypothetical protein